MPVGKPKIFTEEEFEGFVFDYFEFIYKNQLNKKRETPTFYGFYLFVNKKKQCSYHTIRRCFDEYWAEIKNTFEEIRADLLVRGGTIGGYNPTMCIFALKNWCKWADKQEVGISNIDDATRAEVERLVEESKVKSDDTE